MSVEFTQVPTTSVRHQPQYPLHETSSWRSSGARRRLVLEAAFGSVVIDGPAGILTNMDVAAEIARATFAGGIVLSHWSGVIHPVVAAQQIAVLDCISDGRLSLRILFGPDGRAGDELADNHVEALRRTDEYLVLLKRLWSNDRPFDHEGPHYSVRRGMVENKGPQGPDVPIRMGGVSGVALDVAGRHATVFELTPGAPEEIRDLMQRVEAAATPYGRGGRIRFALPVHFASPGQSSQAGLSGAIIIAGSTARVAQTLFSYAALGISEFMVSGLDDETAIAAFARDIAPIFQRTAPIQARRAGGSARRAGPTLRAS